MVEEKTRPKRGGARPGAGRKPLTSAERAANKRKVCRKTIDLTPDESDAVKSAAASAGITPHAWMVRTIQAALNMPFPPD